MHFWKVLVAAKVVQWAERAWLNWDERRRRGRRSRSRRWWWWWRSMAVEIGWQGSGNKELGFVVVLENFLLLIGRGMMCYAYG